MNETALEKVRGYEVSWYYCDGARSYKVYIRGPSRIYWTDVGLVCHAQTPKAEIRNEALKLAERYLAAGGKDR